MIHTYYEKLYCRAFILVIQTDTEDTQASLDVIALVNSCWKVGKRFESIEKMDRHHTI